MDGAHGHGELVRSLLGKAEEFSDLLGEPSHQASFADRH
jgi:hypothetical protein